MKENILLSFQSILNHRLRSLLTMLGIIIGIASIITIVSTIKGTNEQIKSNLIGSGNNVVTVSLSSVEGYYDPEYSEIPNNVRICTEKDRKELLSLSGVKDAALYLQRTWSEGVFFRNNSFSGKVVGADINYLSVYGYRLDKGRGFISEDFTARRKVVIVESTVVASLFEGEDPIGQTLEIKGEPFTVVGIVSPGNETKLKIETPEDYYMYNQNSSGTLFVPIDCWPVLYRYDEPPMVAIKSASTDTMTVAGTNAANALNKNLVTGENYKYTAVDIQEQASQIQEFTSSTNRQLIWIAGISLLVGGIGVMNIMLVSVTERTREIGLKKAIGAKKKRILLQFLTEAGVLTFLGGLIGVLAGIGFSFLLSGLIGTPTAISFPACLIAVVFSIVIGVVFGLIPAVKASNLNPIDALRRD
ncbi:MAG: ABC transporter permease [Parasporobacterium sp.]|nr:ABC transporter permease [Parasporobacterium sp.]